MSLEISHLTSFSDEILAEEEQKLQTKQDNQLLEENSSEPQSLSDTILNTLDAENLEIETPNEDIDHLKSINTYQQEQISNLKEQINELANSSDAEISDQELINRLKQMLSESETCINMLEEELVGIVAELNQKSLQVAALSKQETDPKLIEKDSESNANSVNQEELKTLQSQLDDAMSMTMTMMTANGDQSNIISFARNSISSNSYEELAKEVLNIVTGYGLEGYLQLRCKNKTLNESTIEVISAQNMARLEDELEGERFKEDGSCLTIRFDKISLVVQGMPETEPDTFARYRDTLTIIMELASDHLSTLEDELALQQQHAVLKKVISTTQDTLIKVEEQFNYQAEQSKLIIDSMTNVLGNPTFIKEMSVSFQPVYQGIIKETQERFNELHSENASVDSSFAKIINDLSKRI